jgi:hypothetical protein
LAFVVIWQGPGGAISHCRVFREQASAEEAAGSRRAEGATVTVVDTQWGARAIISSDGQAGADSEERQAGLDAGRGDQTG